MRMLTVIVVATSVFCGTHGAFGQRFLDQLEDVLDAEAKAVKANADKAAAELVPEAIDVAAPGYLGLIAEEASGMIRVELVREAAAAERAGIQVGDVIRRIGNRNVATLDAMGEALAGRLEGERILLSIRRGEKELELPVTLGVRPKSATRPKQPSPESASLPDVGIDALDALVELERLLDKETLPREPAERAVDASNRKRIAEFEGELGKIKRRIAELERGLAELVGE